MNAEEKKAYMREWRKKRMQTEEGRAKKREENRRWKKSENGKKYNREWAKGRYVPSDRVLKTPEEKKVRLRKYWNAVAGPKRMRKHRENMEHLKRYNLTKEEYLSMLEAQNNRCLICEGDGGASRNNRVLCVDHDHNTGKVRGLLCDNCNRGIGSLKDDPAIVEKALLYLRRFSGA